MASFRSFLTLCFLISHFKTLTAASNPSFSFRNFGQNSSFGSVLALYGDAKVDNGGSSVQITAPLVSSAGGIIYKKPLKLRMASFSTYFSFSISTNGSRLAFDLFPFGQNPSLGLSDGTNFNVSRVEFDTLDDGNHHSLVRLKVKNLSTVKSALNSGEKLQSWIDYEAGSRRLEVRLTKFGENRPLDPLLFDQIDLPKIWAQKERFSVGLTSSNGNSSQTSNNVYAWSFKARQVPDWMHSQPLDPTVLKDAEMKIHKKKSDLIMRLLSAFILGIGCGALGTFMGVFLWTIFGKKRPIVPEEFGEKCVEEFEHKRLMVVLDKASPNEKQ